MSNNPYRVLIKPVITEKSLGAKEASRTLCFRVEAGATKPQIQDAVQKIFKVKVESVRTAIFHGKTRRRGRTEGRQPDWKKAFVKLKAGEKMPEYAEGV